MSSCNGNCASCGSDCGERKAESLLAKLNPIAVVLGSLFISMLTVGANSMQISLNVPTSIVNVIQSLIIIFILIMPGIEKNIRTRREKAAHGKEA